MPDRLSVAKFVYGAFLIAPILYVMILLFILNQGYVPVVKDESYLSLLYGVFAVITIVDLVIAYVLPRFMVQRYKREEIIRRFQTSPDAYFLTVTIIQGLLYEAIAIYGLVLGLLGVNWQLTLPFFFISVVAMIITFPCEERYRKFTAL